MNRRRLLVAAFAASIAGCMHPTPPVAPVEPVAVPTSETVISSAPVIAEETKPVAPSIHVSDELARACMLDVDDVSRAPKFAFDKSELADADYAVLTRIARCLDAGALSGKRVILIGRADPRGSSAYNFELGLRRAHRVALFFEDYGIAPERIDEWSQGKLEAVGTDEASWTLDRRVDIFIAE